MAAPRTLPEPEPAAGYPQAMEEKRAVAIADAGVEALARAGLRHERRERKLVYTEIVQRML